MTDARELYEKVIKNNYCIGCGSCSSIEQSPFKMRMDQYGNIVAFAEGDIDSCNLNIQKICPFSEYSKNEDQLGDIFFPEVADHDSRIGKYLACYAGYVTEGQFREKGSSGGFGKWMGYHLLKENKIDYFIHVVPNQSGDPAQPLFDYAVITDMEQVVRGSKSSYYPVTLESVIKTVKDTPGRYAITGVPCFIKTLRLLSVEDETLRSRIRYTIGIVCGGMKSANQAKIIGWQLGVRPEHLIAIDFRRKDEEKSASHKIYQVWSDTDTTERFRDSTEIFGTDWGAGYFKPVACDYCDDVVAETADVSFGDAWLPQFEKDPSGTSLVIVRNSEILEIFKESSEKGKIHLVNLSVEDVIKAQEGGFRHRRDALSYRLARRKAEGKWYPPKRVSPGQYAISGKRKKVYSLREVIAAQSHVSALKALQSGNLSIFKEEITPLLNKYRSAIYGGILIRGFRKLKRMLVGA